MGFWKSWGDLSGEKRGYDDEVSSYGHDEQVAKWSFLAPENRELTWLKPSNKGGIINDKRSI